MTSPEQPRLVQVHRGLGPVLGLALRGIARLEPEIGLPLGKLAGASLLLCRGIRARAEVSPFILSIFLFLLGYAGLAISLWPNLIPPDISIWEAASPPETLSFMIAGFVVLVPIILAYTAYPYWVFRGKVADATGYH